MCVMSLLKIELPRCTYQYNWLHMFDIIPEDGMSINYILLTDLLWHRKYFNLLYIELFKIPNSKIAPSMGSIYNMNMNS